MAFYIRLIDKFNKFLLFIMGTLLIVMVLSITYQVLIRTVFSKIGMQVSAPWAGELPLYCMIWLIFLGAAVATRHNKLISVDMLQSNLPEKWSKIVSLVGIAITIIFFIGLLIAGYYWALYGLTETSTTLRISMFYVYVSLPVSAFIMILNAIGHLISEFFLKENMKIKAKTNELDKNTDFGI